MEEEFEYQERPDGLWAKRKPFAVRTAQTSANGIGVSEDAHSLDGSPEAVSHDSGVRRLTPTECERLQAFPDGWTHGADGKRYAAMGDAVTVNVIQWLGERMMEVHNGSA